MSDTDRSTINSNESMDRNLTSAEGCLVTTTNSDISEPFHDESFTPVRMRDRSAPHGASSNVENITFSATLSDQDPTLLQVERLPESATPKTKSVREGHCLSPTESSPENMDPNDSGDFRGAFSPGHKPTQASSPGSKYERPYHHHFPPTHGHPYPFYYPYYPPPPPSSHSLSRIPSRKHAMSADVTVRSCEQKKAPSEEKLSHPNHLPPPPHPWPYPHHQMYFYPPPHYYPPPSNGIPTSRQDKKESTPVPDPECSKEDSTPTTSSESPLKRKRKSTEPPIHSEKLSEIKERAHDAVRKEQNKNEGVPSTVLEKRARKNAQSRLRAAKLKEKIALIQAKEPSKRTPEETAILFKFEERRQRKNGRSRERAIQRKEEFERIFSKPENLWTEKEKAFMVDTMVAKYKKNEGDRLRRKKMKSDESHSESFEYDSSSIASSTVRVSRKKEVVPPRPHHSILATVHRPKSSQPRTKDPIASVPSQIGIQCKSPRPEAKKVPNDDLLRIPLTPNVPLTPILGNIILQHDGSTPDYGKMFDVTPLHDGSLKEYIFDSKHSEAQVVEPASLELTTNSLLSNTDMANTPKTPNNQKSLPYIQLSSPLNLSPLHLPRRQKMNDGLFDSLTGFGNECHAHENQDKIAVSFSVDSNCEGKFEGH